MLTICSCQSGESMLGWGLDQSASERGQICRCGALRTGFRLVWRALGKTLGPWETDDDSCRDHDHCFGDGFAQQQPASVRLKSGCCAIPECRQAWAVATI